MRRVGHWTPKYVFNRAIREVHSRLHPDQPWLNRQAVGLLGQLVRDSDVVIEWGSGRSTAWLARHAARVVSIEHNRDWFLQVTKQTATMKNVSLHHIEIDTEASHSRPYWAIPETAGVGPDVCFVDGRHRDRCTLAALDQLCPGGLIVLDDSQRYIGTTGNSPISLKFRPGKEKKPSMSGSLPDVSVRSV